MNNASLEVDAKDILKKFSQLNFKGQEKVYRKALTEGAKILQKEAKNTLRQIYGRAVSHKNWWNGKTLQQGIKVSPQRNVEKDGVKVHIMSDFRLKFFESGTNERFTSGHNGGTVKGKIPYYRQHKPHSTGHITASHFFTKSKDQTESQIFGHMDDFIIKNINKIFK